MVRIRTYWTVDQTEAIAVIYGKVFQLPNEQVSFYSIDIQI